MITTWLAWRLVKFLGLALFGGGLWVACSAGRQDERLTGAHQVALVGFVASWLGGYGLMKLAGRSFEDWIVQGMAASMVAGVGAILAATRPGATALGAGLAAAGLAASVGIMVTQGPNPVVLVVALLFGLAAAWSRRGATHPEPAADVPQRTLKWFVWVARLEGASLLFMLGVSMPLRLVAGIDIDGDQGWVGWVHGILTLVYLLALATVSRTGGWGVGKTALGFVASLLPGGTYLFEWRALRA